MKYKSDVTQKNDSIQELARNAAKNLQKQSLSASDCVKIFRQILNLSKQIDQKVSLEREDFSRTK